MHLLVTEGEQEIIVAAAARERLSLSNFLRCAVNTLLLEGDEASELLELRSRRCRSFATYDASSSSSACRRRTVRQG